jgi:DNA end-binding protein Ku
MAALQESVQKAKASRGEGEHATVHELPKKKTAAKKTVKKAAAKKTTKQASAKKPKRSA